ncbi:hypothetical protein PR202_gb17361 [Eleusine coracana subsp. coracana]|uniref:Uncharacterized protein n=1 Tax=Eleusine coracana subsp. coracana TaxID=191504 RepID=A0AAV5F2T1_ELECO|nr:hypothetical protein PR202_gb17361 [Eleusine coracana subsp. coracana]
MPTMSIEQDLHMVSGNGETSYAKNSRLQEKAMFVIKPVLEKAVREAYTNLHPQTMMVTDLGCSSGPNTLHFVSEVIDAITRHCNELNQRHEQVQLQFILNDLPDNDFNYLFRLVEQFKESKAKTHMVGEVENVVKQSGLFDINHLQLFEVNWDPYDDDSESTVLHDSVQSGVNVSKCFRAVMESLVASHFQAGDAILDMLFADYIQYLSRMLSWSQELNPVGLAALLLPRVLAVHHSRQQVLLRRARQDLVRKIRCNIMLLSNTRIWIPGLSYLVRVLQIRWYYLKQDSHLSTARWDPLIIDTNITYMLDLLVIETKQRSRFFTWRSRPHWERGWTAIVDFGTSVNRELDGGRWRRWTMPSSQLEKGLVRMESTIMIDLGRVPT